MSSFLQSVAQRIYADHPLDMDKVTVVFNNHRSGLFLRKQFASLDVPSFFLPRIIGMDQLISELGHFQIVPNEFLLFELFNIHCEIGGDQRKYATFEEFISFADMMLSDFSEIDLYCVDAAQLFSNLHELKEIGKWDIEGTQLTPFQQQYLDFYKSIYQYYSLLHERLLSQGKAYSGMAYREVAEHVDSMIDESEYKHDIYFVGFNALSESESRIIKNFVRRGIGHFITDGDAYYFDDPSQEAGYFLNKHRMDYTEIGGYANHFATGQKKITLVSCPENVLQVKYAGRLLEQLPHDANQDEQTALVLADEGLLVPVLNALPQSVEAANVTMGFPFVNTNAHALMMKLLALYSNARRELFYHRNVIDLLSDYYVGRLLHNEDLHSIIVEGLASEQVIYTSGATLKEILSKSDVSVDDIEFLFSSSEISPNDFLEICTRLIEVLVKSEVFDNNHKEREVLAYWLQIVQYLRDIQQQYSYIQNLTALQKVYERLARKRSISFYGEPLSGLQILGVLETRNLDFKRVIMLSVNEDVLPSGKSNNTLIPLGLKVNAGMPSYTEKEAVYAYNFYRLLQRAEEVYLVYNTETTGMGKGEPSRFILQLQAELAKRYPDHITIEEQVVTVDNITLQDSDSNEIRNVEAVRKRLLQMNEKGFSPSALNVFRGCPKRFYYQNVLSVYEQQNVEEDIDQSELGTCIHEVLEAVYRQAIGGHVTVELLQNGLKQLDTYLDASFQKVLQKGRTKEGRNLFLHSVARAQLSKFLEHEIKLLKEGEHTLSMVDVESKMTHPLALGDDFWLPSANIQGVSDRIDRFDDHLRIVDYKSGSVDPGDLKLKVSNGELKVPDKWFQVMQYAWVYRNAHHLAEDMVSGIYPLRSLGSDFIPAEMDGVTLLGEQQFSKFEEMLREVVRQVLDLNHPFEATPSKACAYCPFATSCSQSEV